VFNRWHLLFLLAGTLACGCRTFPSSGPGSRFVAMERFDSFLHSVTPSGETVWLSPPISAGMHWDQLIVSWNATAPAGTFLKVEAAALRAGHTTGFYQLGNWSPDNGIFPRSSQPGKADANGRVKVDTLALRQPAEAVRLRLTLGGTNHLIPAVKYIGLSFENTHISPAPLQPNRAAWGRVIATPMLSQHGWPGAKGWCSPTAVAMVLARWAKVLSRSELNVPVPVVAAAVYDRAYAGTGNWPFNTAYAGEWPGMRGYVTRFDDLSEVEDWIAAGIPVILSVRWDLLAPGRPRDPDGHLLVCTGFTTNGDVVVNDPATPPGHPEMGQHIYQRSAVLRAWAQSHHTVYLIYPEGARLPANRQSQW